MRAGRPGPAFQLKSTEVQPQLKSIWLEQLKQIQARPATTSKQSHNNARHQGQPHSPMRHRPVHPYPAQKEKKKKKITQRPSLPRGTKELHTRQKKTNKPTPESQTKQRCASGASMGMSTNYNGANRANGANKECRWHCCRCCVFGSCHFWAPLAHLCFALLSFVLA